MGLLLFITGLLIVLVGVSLRSQADAENTTTAVGITNATPTVNTMLFGYATNTEPNPTISAFTLEEASTKDVHIFGTYSDENGCEDVSASGTMKLVFYRTGSAATSTATTGLCDAGANMRYCYDDTIGSPAYVSSSNVGSSCTGGTDTTATYDFALKVKFYADPTSGSGTDTEFASETWGVHVYAVDAAYATGTRWSSIEMNDLTALTLLDSTIQFGTLAVDAETISTSNGDTAKMVAAQNSGNRNMLDVGLSGTALTCSLGTIAVGQVKYATGTYDSGLTYTTYPGTLSSGSAVSAGFYLGIARGAEGVETGETVSTNTHWGIKIPTGVSGSCAGTITFTAQAQP